MQQAIKDLTVATVTPNAVIQQQMEFGDIIDYSEFSVERVRFGVGFDITPLLKGLQDDMCPRPHWGYVLGGALNVRYIDGTERVEETGDAFYLPPEHTTLVDEETEFILFSLQHEHANVLKHLADKMGG